MKKNKYIFLFGMAAVIVTLLAACNNLFDAPSDQLPAGYGRVSINITGGETERIAQALPKQIQHLNR